MDEEPTLSQRKGSTNSASLMIDKTHDDTKRRKGRNKNCDMNLNKWKTISDAATFETAPTGGNSRLR